MEHAESIRPQVDFGQIIDKVLPLLQALISVIKEVLNIAIPLLQTDFGRSIKHEINNDREKYLYPGFILFRWLSLNINRTTPISD